MPDQPTQSYNYCALPLAAYACQPDQSRGRLYNEPDSTHRTPFQRDRDRIIHSTAWRRLQYKTQVFVYYEGDHYRNRMTHSLEVAQVARTMARALYLNEDLSEAIALAHDLGHSPFAHKGEDVLAELMKNYGGFAHNDQTVRVLTELEHRYPKWNGLNLSFETLEGTVKHNGPALGAGEDIDKLPHTIRELSDKIDFQLYDHAPLEAQVVDLADDIAYNNHDVEDGLRAGYFTLDDLMDLKIYDGIIRDVRQNLKNSPEPIVIYEIIREQIGSMIDDAIQTTRDHIRAMNPQSVDDVRMAGRQLVRFSPGMFEKLKELRAFMFAKVYDPHRIEEVAEKAETIIGGLFNHYMARPDQLPESWQGRMMGADASQIARVVADYIAGMTDRFAMRDHTRLFGSHWDVNN
jgi:dGTPase